MLFFKGYNDEIRIADVIQTKSSEKKLDSIFNAHKLQVGRYKQYEAQWR